MRMISRIFILSALVATASCAAPRTIPYFQDLQSGSEQAVSAGAIRMQPGDKISIIVNARDPQISDLFNLPYTTRTIGMNASYSSSTPQGISGYTVDSAGNIDFPILGAVHVAGLTREETAAMLKDRLVSGRLANDVVVTVECLNHKVSVMGEVAHPGRYAIDNDEFTIFDAISAAGDLTIFGERSKIKVLRTENGVSKAYFIDMCSAEDVLKSPVYRLQQNDIVYVEPNKMRARQSTVNGNNVLSTSFWISIASLATTVLLAVNQFVKK